MKQYINIHEKYNMPDSIAEYVSGVCQSCSSASFPDIANSIRQLIISKKINNIVQVHAQVNRISTICFNLFSKCFKCNFCELSGNMLKDLRYH